MPKKTKTSQKSAKNQRKTGWVTQKQGPRPKPPAQPKSRPVKAQFKAGKDI